MNIHSVRRMVKGKPEPDDSPKREAILDAALELFAEFGYHGTAVPQVAERARVGAGTLYRYFENKEALVNALFQKWKQALARALVQDFPIDQPVRAQFHEIWRRLAQFATQHPRALDFLELHHHGSYLDACSVAVEKEMMLPVNAFVDQAKRQQILKPLAPELLGALVWGAFMGLVGASRKGFVELSKKTLDAAEECMWEAIRR
jgi:TetR/AcrR family transcriptional regulator, repressor of fatR-cypB operon